MELRVSNISEARDGYKLGFVGKDYARLQIGQSSETVIVPDSDHNNLPENINSENVFITGDNLEALRLIPCVRQRSFTLILEI